MGPIPIDRIISISSEDQAHKAENILKVSDTNQTWRCKAGEKQATIILQFLKSSVVSSIDVGNDNSAFVEVFVGKSTSDEFQSLLVTSSLMTLNECKNGLNVNKVRFFDTSQLSDACKETWDRVKIVCTQPYIKQAKFGLSFITFHSKDITKLEVKKELTRQQQSSSIQLGSFILKDDDSPDDDICSVGRLFAKRHENKEVVRMPESPINRLLAQHKKNIEAASTSKNKKITSLLSDQKVSKKDSIKPKKNDVNKNDVKKNDLVISPIVQNTVTKRKESLSSSTNPDSSRKKIKLIKNPLPATKHFSELLSDVIFTMSGYENPHRSNLRSKALEMGATYKVNLDPSCTHLLCAFINTPKFKEAKRQGTHRIVISDWIDKCYASRCRYPWRRFALDKMEKNKPESEDEIHELIEPEQADDTDDEWNNVSMRPPIPSTSQIDISTEQSISIYDADTDIDSDPGDIDILADESYVPLPVLDDTFSTRLFYLSPCLEPELRKKCNRYITSLDGKFSTEDKCDYIISTDKNDFKLKHSVVSPQWIWDCYDAKKILPLK